MTLKEAAESVTRRLREAEARRLVTAGRERDEFDEMSDELEKHPIGLPRGRPCPECVVKDERIAELVRERDETRKLLKSLPQQVVAMMHERDAMKRERDKLKAEVARLPDKNTAPVDALGKDGA